MLGYYARKNTNVNLNDNDLHSIDMVRFTLIRL